MYGSCLKKLRTTNGITQTELGKRLGVIKQTISNWENDISEPGIDTLIKYAELFGVSLDEVVGRDYSSLNATLGYPAKDELAVTFPNKLLLEMYREGKDCSAIAQTLGITENEVIEWILGKSDTYKNYYPELSTLFSVKERYWTSPGAISPGIEPTAEEYDLILVKRKYNETGEISSPYGNLQKFFPSVRISESEDELFMIDSYRQMNQDSKEIIRGQMKQVLRDQRRDESLGNAASAK